MYLPETDLVQLGPVRVRSLCERARVRGSVRVGVDDVIIRHDQVR